MTLASVPGIDCPRHGRQVFCERTLRMMFYRTPTVSDTLLAANCCKIDCTKNATWSLVYGPSPDDSTQSCDDHFAELLGDSPLLDVTRIGEQRTVDYLEVLFDGPPSAQSGRFVELEARYANFPPQGVNAPQVEWVQDGDLWRLRIPVTGGCVYG